MKNILLKYQNDFYSIIDKIEYQINQRACEDDLFFYELFQCFEVVKNNHNKLFFIGNGASNAMASHFSTDFTKNGEISSMAFTDGSLLTCYSNDYSFVTSFREILNRQFKQGDGLIAISSSGNSMNIVNSCDFIRENYPECIVLTLTGFKPDSKLRSSCSHNVYVPGFTYGLVESAHSYLLHCILDLYIDTQVKMK